MVGFCENCNGTGASTMLVVYLMDVVGVYSLRRNNSVPCSQLNS